MALISNFLVAFEPIFWDIQILTRIFYVNFCFWYRANISQLNLRLFLDAIASLQEGYSCHTRHKLILKFIDT